MYILYIPLTLDIYNMKQYQFIYFHSVYIFDLYLYIIEYMNIYIQRLGTYVLVSVILV